MFETTCHQCGRAFVAKRRSARYCGAACRKAKSRAGIPANRQTSATEARRQDELFDLHLRMCETYYGLPPADRQVYLKHLIDRARSGDRLTRRILTNWVFLRPHGMRPRTVFHRGCREYPTLAQEAHALAKWYWDAGIAYVLDHPDLAPYRERVAADRQKLEAQHQRQFRKALAGLPRIAPRPEHVQKAVAMAIIARKGPVLSEAHRVRWGL